MNRTVLFASLLLIVACDQPTETELNTDAAPGLSPPPGVTELLWGSSSLSSVNPASLFTIDTTTGAVTLVGASGVAEGSNRISGIDFDPITGTLYGIKGGACHGAILITLDPTTGAGTMVDTLSGGWFDGTPGPLCPGGADGLAFAPDGTLYVVAWYGGIPQGKIMKVDKATGTVLEVHPTPIGYDDWHGRRAHMSGIAIDGNGKVWVSRGSSAVPGQINSIDPSNGNILSTLYLTDGGGLPEDSITISDLAFGPGGTLFASLPWENMLATIDTTTGVVTRIGGYGASVDRISGMATVPRLLWTLLGDFNHDGVVRRSIVGTKYDAALDAATAATFVVVASWLDPPYVQRIAGFQNARGRRVAMFQTGSNGWPSMQFLPTMGSTIDVRWSLDFTDDVRRVFHIVWDTNHPDENKRIRFYVNGVDQGPGTYNSGSPPGPGLGLDFGLNNLELQMMNQTRRRRTRAMAGTVFYYAVYSAALGDAEVAADAALLTADDDGPP
jgi:hypothetical protein